MKKIFTNDSQGKLAEGFWEVWGKQAHGVWGKLVWGVLGRRVHGVWGSCPLAG